MLVSFVAWFIAIWNYNMFDNYMVSRLYRIKKQNPNKLVWNHSIDKADPMVPRILHNPREYFKDLLCLKRIRCCNSNRTEKGFEVGRAYLSHETNIVSIIQSVRFFKKAIKLLLS